MEFIEDKLTVQKSKFPHCGIHRVFRMYLLKIRLKSLALDCRALVPPMRILLFAEDFLQNISRPLEHYSSIWGAVLVNIVYLFLWSLRLFM